MVARRCTGFTRPIEPPVRKSRNFQHWIGSPASRSRQIYQKGQCCDDSDTHMNL
jgi:hypothetical protein